MINNKQYGSNKKKDLAFQRMLKYQNPWDMLREYVKTLGISNTQIAKHSGLDPKTVRNALTGKNTRILTYKKILVVLRVDFYVAAFILSKIDPEFSIEGAYESFFLILKKASAASDEKLQELICYLDDRVA